jgi:hypothetical protein
MLRPDIKEGPLRWGLERGLKKALDIHERTHGFMKLNRNQQRALGEDWNAVLRNATDALIDGLKEQGQDGEAVWWAYLRNNPGVMCDYAPEYLSEFAHESSFLSDDVERKYHALAQIRINDGAYQHPQVEELDRKIVDRACELIKMRSRGTPWPGEESRADDNKETIPMTSITDKRAERLLDALMSADPEIMAEAADEADRMGFTALADALDADLKFKAFKTAMTMPELCRKVTSPDYQWGLNSLAGFARHLSSRADAATKQQIALVLKDLQASAQKLPQIACHPHETHPEAMKRLVATIDERINWLVDLGEKIGDEKHLMFAQQAAGRLKDAIWAEIYPEGPSYAQEGEPNIEYRADDPERGLLGDPTPALESMPTELEEESPGGPFPISIRHKEPEPLGRVPTKEEVVEAVKGQVPLDPKELRGMDRKELSFLRDRLSVVLNVVEKALGMEPTLTLSPREQEEHEEREVMRGTFKRPG